MPPYVRIASDDMACSCIILVMNISFFIHTAQACPISHHTHQGQIAVHAVYIPVPFWGGFVKKLRLGSQLVAITHT